MANGLTNLFAKQKAASNGQVASDSGAAKAGSSESKSERPSEDRTESVQGSTQAGTATAQRPANPFAARKSSGSADQSGDTGGESAPSGGNDSSGGQPRPRLANLSLKPKSQHPSDDSGSVATGTINSLDDLDQLESEGIAPRPSMTSAFADETPAEKPTRELPEGLSKEQLGFIDMIDGVYEVVHDGELLGGVIRNIMIELQNNPEYMKLVAPDDIRTWVRGMRESMGLAKIKKQESKAKRSGGAGRKSKLVDNDMLADLASLGVEIPE